MSTPTPTATVLHLREVPVALHDRLKALAKANGRTLQGQCLVMLSAGLAAEEKAAAKSPLKTVSDA